VLEDQFGTAAVPSLMRVLLDCGMVICKGTKVNEIAGKPDVSYPSDPARDPGHGIGHF
jgi:hypothetical protein